MSKETMEWLSENTLTGYCNEHGAPWHRGQHQWDGAIPLTAVADLFSFTADCHPLTVKVPNFETLTDDEYVVPGRQAVVKSDDPSVVFGIFKRTQRADGSWQGYQPHQYSEWLVDAVASVLDVSAGELQIGSAGLLQQGGQAWVQVRPNEGISVGGDSMVPWLLASTSHNGTIATQYRGVVTRTVCDNTLAMALSERGRGVFKLKHTTRSTMRLGEAREALEMLFTERDAFMADVERLMNTAVTDDQWRAIVDTLEPAPADGASVGTTNGANRRREKLSHLYREDKRVAPYVGTAWGILQAFNTRDHWHVGTADTSTAFRQMERTVGGDVEKDDAVVIRTIDKVLSAA